MTTRDAKGRFTSKQSCPIKQCKDWVRDNKENIVTLACIVAIIFTIATGIIWLFGDKVTQEQSCYNFTRTNWSCYHDGYWAYYYPDYILTNYTPSSYDTPCLPIIDQYCNSIDVHSRYTIPEAGTVVINGTTGIVYGFITWVMSHPVI